MDATNYTMYGEKYLKSQLEHDLALTGVVARESPCLHAEGMPRMGTTTGFR